MGQQPASWWAERANQNVGELFSHKTLVLFDIGLNDETHSDIYNLLEEILVWFPESLMWNSPCRWLEAASSGGSAIQRWTQTSDVPPADCTPLRSAGGCELAPSLHQRSSSSSSQWGRNLLSSPAIHLNPVRHKEREGKYKQNKW